MKQYTSPKNYEFYQAVKQSELLDGTTLEVSIRDWDILLCRYKNKIYAIENRCTHQGRKLSGGCLRKGQIICPFHGARFDLSSGTACGSTTIGSIKIFPVREIDGMIEIAIPNIL